MQKLTLAAALAALVAATASAEDLSPAQMESKERLASELEVNAADFTLSQLIQMKSVVGCGYSAGETERRLEAIAGTTRVTDAAATEASKERLANELNVNAADYSLEGLIQLKSMIDQGEDCNIPNPEDWAKAGEKLTPNLASTKQVLAESLRVDPDEYSLAELVKMKFDREE